MAVELADIVVRHSAAYRERFGDAVLPSHRRAMGDIATCRTPARGRRVYVCDGCEVTRYSYHSCRNRHCPKCQNADVADWVDQQRERLLPVPYFLFTFTLPAELRAIAFAHQKTVYGLLFRRAVEALQTLAWDPSPQHLGARLGVLGVLHTWTRELRFHPHVRLLVPAGGVSEDGTRWVPAPSPAFLVPVRALSIVFRAKLRDALRGTELFDQVPARVWTKRWVVHAEPVGTGDAVLRYLPPYVYRTAITNRPIVRVEGGRVTFTARSRKTGRAVAHTVTAFDFLRRFLQHVLPRRFVRVRAYGFLAARTAVGVPQVRRLIGDAVAVPASSFRPESNVSVGEGIRCPCCKELMRLAGEVVPASSSPVDVTAGTERGPP